MRWGVFLFFTFFSECSFFAYNRKLPAYSGAFLLAVVFGSFFTYRFSNCICYFSFLTYNWSLFCLQLKLFAYNGKVHQISTLKLNYKQKSSSCNKEASPFVNMRSETELVHVSSYPMTSCLAPFLYKIFFFQTTKACLPTYSCLRAPGNALGLTMGGCGTKCGQMLGVVSPHLPGVILRAVCQF